MIVAVEILDAFVVAPVAFAIGLTVGFAAANRWRLDRRNGVERR